MRLTEMLEHRVLTNRAFVQSIQQWLARLSGQQDETIDSKETKLP